MDFLAYAERSAALVNARPADAAALREHLADRPWLQERVTDEDVERLRDFTTRLRPVFEASSAGDAKGVVARLNDLLATHPVTPMISDHDARLHLHVATEDASAAELLIGESLLGLATLVCDLGPTRLGVCSEPRCDNAFVDTSPNRSRRYCSERCSSRANVAAFRARQRAAAV
ncbi:hypothetical protein DDE18_03215 [Nocardioides gansuensis]|uniref:Zinc finger CGNR domain-containing protein n=1 Tax=Nocardioides gansuensis TaxID=2138300 RepID=A0A2T8FG00_9ACTN|nr:CGNR zinc finger domain-containing protein [Nocardioides gansuensis]PVG84625.1 hypothetical protein DDE18_03215 [Nocardioides gansuensis]